MVESAFDIMIIRDYLGHSDVKQTQVYAHITQKRKDAEAGKMLALEYDKKGSLRKFRTKTG